jgi:TetR/AcrR family transcriptional repressor of uid operon
MDKAGVAAEKPLAIARRRQVLEAAAHCFRRHGFHASSMAQISAEAGMSVGHIYRYFPSKEAIIAAIVRQDVDDILLKFAEFPSDSVDLRAALRDRAELGVNRASELDQASLMVEIRAEAARNPAIGALVRQADAVISAQLRTLIGSAVGRDLQPSDLDARVEMFQLIFQGISLRTIVNPAIDRTALSQMVKLAIDAILT